MERLLNYWKRSFNFNRLILHFWKVFNSTGVMISIAGLYTFYVCVFSLFSGLNVVWNLFFASFSKVFICALYKHHWLLAGFFSKFIQVKDFVMLFIIFSFIVLYVFFLQLFVFLFCRNEFRLFCLISNKVCRFVY